MRANIIALAVVLVCGCANNKQPSPMFGNQSAWIPGDQVPVVRAAALNGDGAAAYRLAQFYERVEGNASEAMRFLRLAAVSNLDAKYSLGLHLADYTEAVKHEEGIKILKEAAKEGSREAQQVIEIRGY